jgi:hypothetical protein
MARIGCVKPGFSPRLLTPAPPDAARRDLTHRSKPSPIKKKVQNLPSSPLASIPARSRRRPAQAVGPSPRPPSTPRLPTPEPDPFLFPSRVAGKLRAARVPPLAQIPSQACAVAEETVVVAWWRLCGQAVTLVNGSRMRSS